MKLKNMLPLEFTLAQLNDVTSKKQILELIAHAVSKKDDRVKFSDIFDALQKREKLGSTAVGYGVAIPHARVKNITHPLCLLLTLQNPVEFDHTDDIHHQSVDIVLSLLVPEKAPEKDLHILSEMATQLKDKTFRDKLLLPKTNDALFKVAMG